MKERVDKAFYDARYKSLFEHAAVSMWELDITRLRTRLREMTKAGVDIRPFMVSHPEFAQELAQLIDVTDANRASVALVEAQSKEQLVGRFSFLLEHVSRDALVETMLAVSDGRTEIEVESTGVTLKGRKLRFIARTYIPPADSPYERMIVSLIDITARREAEERERMSADILRSVLESAPLAIQMKDRSLRTILCNEAHSRSLGKRPEETYGKTDIENGWDPDLVKGNPAQGIEGWEKDDLAALAGETVHVSCVPMKVGNETRYFDVAKMPLRDRKGAVIGLIGIGRDVTNHRSAEAALKRERDFLSALMENLPYAIYIKDLESRFLRTSWSHAHTLGLEGPEEAIGKTDADFYTPEHAEEARRDELQIIRTGLPLMDIEEKETYADRPDAWVVTTKMPLRDEQGRIVGTFGISRDITQRKMLEEKNQQLATLVESSDDAIVGLDLERCVTVWNKGAEKIFGYTAAEMIGARTSILIPPELEEEERAIHERLLRGEVVEHFETTRLKRSGERITISLTLSAIKDASGTIVGMGSVARDVTAEKALQTQLNRVQRLKSLATLATGVAHQFNNINTVMKGYFEVVRSDPELPNRLGGYVDAAFSALARAVAITDRLLALTSREGSAQAVNLERLGREVVDDFESRIRTARVVLELAMEPTPEVMGDPARLKFVLSSLVGNALDSLLDRPERRITVRTGVAGDGVLFEVKDTGCGIPERDMPRIFSPFFSAKGEWAPPGSSQSKAKGVGLSLAICSSTISEYGGRIDVRSVEQTGSVFRVTLPKTDTVRDVG